MATVDLCMVVLVDLPRIYWINFHSRKRSRDSIFGTRCAWEPGRTSEKEAHDRQLKNTRGKLAHREPGK